MQKNESNKNIDDMEADDDNLKFIQPTNLDINKNKSGSKQIQTELNTIPNETYSGINQHDEQDNPENNIAQNNNQTISDKKNEFNSPLLYQNQRDKTPRYILYLLIIFILSVVFYFMIFKNNNSETNPTQETKKA